MPAVTDPLISLMATDKQEREFQQSSQLQHPIVQHLCGIHDTGFVGEWIARLDKIEAETGNRMAAALADDMQAWREQFRRGSAE